MHIRVCAWKTLGGMEKTTTCCSIGGSFSRTRSLALPVTATTAVLAFGLICVNIRTIQWDSLFFL